jgi:serine/threonine protein kinase
METHESPKHRPLPRSYPQSSSARFKLDACRGSNRMYQKDSKDKSTRSRGCPSHRACEARGTHFFLKLCDVAEGLNYLHSRNVIHRGIMGVRAWRHIGDRTNAAQANILVDRLGRAHITDFTLTEIACDQGSARRVTDLPDHDTRWTAPEVLEGAPRLTKEGDIFSFSMVMVEVRCKHIFYGSLRPT